MAQSTFQVPPTDLRAGPTTAPSSSLARTASNNSAASSLRRRSRTRTRALSTSSRRGKSLGPTSDSGEEGRPFSSHEDVPPLPPLLISDREDDVVSSSGESFVFSLPPPRRYRPSTSERRQVFLTDSPPEVPFRGRERSHSSANPRDVFVDITMSRGRQTRSEGGSVRGVRTSVRGSSLPRHAFRHAGSSSPQPSPLTPSSFMNARLTGGEHTRRDSVVSYGSSTSSSLYPQSTSTASRPESSLAPLSYKGRDDDESSFSPRIVTHSDKETDFDIDDVSYRLRLLVNNSYFLPPAHAKPTPLSLSPQTTQPGQKPAKPSGSSGILGFFGLGKPKGKPTLPAAQNPAHLELPPLLRTTSDSISTPGHAPRPPPRSLPQTPMHTPFPLPHANPGSRVVVLREKMDDLRIAARQAEKDIKIKAEARKATNYSAPPDLGYVDDVIDPTDAVDLPTPAEPFLGVQEAVGAEVLAEHLPPSPGMWSMSTEEDSWRKALLREAVSHSLVNTPEQSFSMSASPHRPSPSDSNYGSFRDSFPNPTQVSEENATDSTPKTRIGIGQRIMEPEQIVQEVTTSDPPPISASPTSNAMVVGGSGPSPPGDVLPHSPWRQSISRDAFRRAETPALAHSLAPPPPRRNLPPYSLSHTDLPATASKDSDTTHSSDSSKLLRKAVSSPRLSAMPVEALDMRMIPSPSNTLQQISPASSTTQLRNVETAPTHSTVRHTVSSLTSSSQYSDEYATPTGEMDDDEPDARPSLTISLHTDPHSSMYSHPSPTASAFQDAVFGSCRTPSPLQRRSHQGSRERFTPLPSDLPSRSATLSPPPRVSSSLGPTILPPPPRSPAHKPVYRPSTSSSASHKSGCTSHSSTPLQPFGLEEGSEEHEPDTPTSPPIPLREPMTPSQPLAERRGRPPSLALRIPTEVIPPAIHSAPAPASPTAFFDRIQSQHNAMDDLETSDESEDECTSGGKSDGSPPFGGRVQRPFAEPTRLRALSGGAATPSGSKPTLTRLGNHSTPHLSPSPVLGDAIPSFDLLDRKPVSNIPEVPQRTFFASRKKARGDFPLGLVDAQGSKVSLALSTGSADSKGSPSPLRVTPTDVAGPSSSTASNQQAATADTLVAPRGRYQRESLQRFDGMLLQHIAAEKDTIKRITTNISGSRR